MVPDFLELETWSELVALVTSDPPLALSFLAAEISEYNYLIIMIK